MRKLIVVLLTGLMFLAACSSDSDTTSNTTTNNEKSDDPITVWAWDPYFNIAALEIAEGFYKQENSDATFEFIESAQDDVVQKLNTTLGSGTTKGLPNIALIEDYRAHSFLQAFPDSFYPLTDVFNPDDFAEYKVTSTTFEDEIYGIPFDTGVTGLYVRTDYLEEAGYSIEDMQDISWKEYIDIGKEVKEATGIDFISVDPSDLGVVRIMMQSAGSWYTEDDGVTPHLEGNEPLKEALQIYKEMLDADIVKPHTDSDENLSIVNSGDVVTTVTGNWYTPSIKNEESQAGKWAVVPIPSLDISGAVNASNLGGSSWYVFDIPGAKEAADFLGKTFGSNSEFYQDLLTEVGAIGTYIPASDGEAYSTEDEFFQGQTIFSDFAEWTEDVPGINYGMHTYAIDDIVVVEMQNFINGKDLDDVLKDAQAEAESQLN